MISIDAKIALGREKALFSTENYEGLFLLVNGRLDHTLFDPHYGDSESLANQILKSHNLRLEDLEERNLYGIQITSNKISDILGVEELQEDNGLITFKTFSLELTLEIFGSISNNSQTPLKRTYEGINVIYNGRNPFSEKLKLSYELIPKKE